MASPTAALPRAETARSRTSRTRRKILALLVGLIVAGVLLEAGTRVFFAFQAGPRVLAYGTPWFRNTSPDQFEERVRTTDELFATERQSHLAAEEREDSVERHGNALGAYTKFFPNEDKSTRDVDTGERIPVRINSHGYRGDEFEEQKPEGVVRVLTCGASSTFGFYNRDDETYPHFLELELNERCPGESRRFEVINFAIPHASAASVAAMLSAEGLGLKPDVVTFYEGRNDSGWRPEPDGFLDKAYSVLVHRLLCVAFLDQALVGDRLSVTAPNLNFEAFARDRSEEFLRNLSVMRRMCEEHDILLIVASQQATGRSPFPRTEVERLPMRGVTYPQEVAEVRERFDAGKEITSYEFSFLVHDRLMSDLRAWAGREDVPFVDVIGALDQDRHHLLTWVHLHPEGNKIVARELANAILNKLCP